MTWLIMASAAVLAAVAALGVLWPFGRGRQVRLEGAPGPLDDERESLLRALRELEQERGAGTILEEDYRALRSETERRAVAVLRALEAQAGAGELAAGLREVRAAGAAPSSGEGGRGRPARALAIGVVAALAMAAVVPALAAAVRQREPGSPLTGEIAGGTDGMEFFEQRVRDHPDDPAARLDLAQRYLERGEVRKAIEQYRATLDLDPRNVEAHAKLAFLLYAGGRPEDALRAVDLALEVDPRYPEALYFRGVILLRGLDRAEEAAEAFRAYLDAAPFGALRPEVERLLAEAEAG